MFFDFNFNYGLWREGYDTGMNNPTLQSMSPRELRELGKAHESLNTSSDYGMGAACSELAWRKEHKP